MSKSIVVVDLGTGNLRSVAKACEAVASSHTVRISNRVQDIDDAHRLVLPGQGAIGTWMQQLADDNLRQSLHNALSAKPVLGICLGLQALVHDSSENGGVDCLNVLPGRVVRFGEAFTLPAHYKVPHMGWNTIHQTRAHPLWAGIDDHARFYFVHSYHLSDVAPDQTAGECTYGQPFAVALAKENLFAVQFHPEKSQHDGLRLLTNFCEWNGST